MISKYNTKLNEGNTRQINIVCLMNRELLSRYETIHIIKFAAIQENFRQNE